MMMMLTFARRVRPQRGYWYGQQARRGWRLAELRTLNGEGTQQNDTWFRLITSVSLLLFVLCRGRHENEHDGGEGSTHIIRPTVSLVTLAAEGYLRQLRWGYLIRPPLLSSEGS